MIMQTTLEWVIIAICWILFFSLGVYVAGALCKKESGKQGYGTAFIVSLIFILVRLFVLQPFLFVPGLIEIVWIQYIILFLFLLVLFAIFYDISFGGALLAAIICVVVLWALGFVVDWIMIIIPAI